MTLDDYKQLMLWHMMDADLTGYHYASVDGDGKLHLYRYKPVIALWGDRIWLPLEEHENTGEDSHFAVISQLTSGNVHWKDSLMQL